MKKSCLVQESKVVTTQNIENVLNASKDSKDSKEQLTEEQLLINRKLLESGILEEGLGWLEKRNIFKTINVSLDTAGNEKSYRSSPRLVKATNVKPSKWIDNSFENARYDEKVLKTKLAPKESECSSSKKPTSTSCKKRPNQETQKHIVKNNNKIETSLCEKSEEEGSESNKNSLKCSNKVHYIKIEIENSKEKCDLPTEENSQSVNLAKKRASQPEAEVTPKKLKMEETNDGVSLEKESPLTIELETGKIKRSEPNKLRDIKAIVSEYETRNKRWKETFLKYKCPARWGIPIVRNCSEKGDGKQIPPKLLQRYQKYLLSKNLTHPVFFPVKSHTSDLIKFSESSSPSSTSISSECTNESEATSKNLGERPYIQEDSGPIGLENNLDVSSSVKDSGRMVLRNRSQQKTVISDDEDFSSDESDDWLDKQKYSKKQKTNAKNKKSLEHNNKQLVLKLEKCDINTREGNAFEKKNGIKTESRFLGEPIMSSNSVTGENFKSRPDPDTMVCPICSFRFEKQHIESHATFCASKTYKD